MNVPIFTNEETFAIFTSSSVHILRFNMFYSLYWLD